MLNEIHSVFCQDVCPQWPSLPSGTTTLDPPGAAWGLNVNPYVSAPAVAGPKVPRHDGADVSRARSAARGLACNSAAHGPARGAARVSL